jgi:predicted enzyme related to lactoylglutathione lyase
VPPHWMICFHVPDIDAANEHITVDGGKILN